MTGRDRPHTAASSGRVLLAIAVLLAVWTSGSRTSLSTVHGFGDGARYLMDGAFLADLVRAGAVQHPSAVVAYAEHYYAQYPALSLGHHPPLFPMSLVPFFLGLGISALAARLAMVVWFVGAVGLLFALGRRMYDDRVAGWAALLLATCPVVVRFADQILTEVPTIAIVLAALLLLARFRASASVGTYLWFVASVMASVLMRPTAAYMVPLYAVLLLRDDGMRRLMSGRIVVVNAVGLVLGIVVVAAYLTWSPFNSAVVRMVVGRGIRTDAVVGVALTVVSERALAVGVLAGLACAVFRRDRRVLVPIAWAASVLACTLVLTGNIEPQRYAILAIPAMCLIAASVVATAETRVTRTVAALALAALVAWQVLDVSRGRDVNLAGYEEAARYVVDVAHEPTVFYSAASDTGYFIFFVRQFDSERRLAVLRSDKLLTTSLMTRLNVESRIASAEEIPPILQRYGTRFVAIEDQPTGDRTLDWLRTLVRSERFVERRRFPIGPGLPGVDLVVYEYLDATPAAPDAVLDLNLPLVGRRVVVPLRELGH